MVHPEDEVFAITSAGGVIRTSAAEIKQSGRQTMGVRLVNLANGQTLVAIARNAETNGNLGGEDPDPALASDEGAGEHEAQDAQEPEAD
jgi:DNA gyrase subunit A